MKKPKKDIFIEDCGIFKNDILVCVNVSYEDILQFAKKKKLFNPVIEYLTKQQDIIKQLVSEKLGFVFELGPIKAYLLWFKEYDYKKWEDIERLLHEIYHLVDFVARQKSFENEMEAKAYLFEDLFSKIRWRLGKNER